MILEKFKEVLATVLPISILVIIFNFTIIPVDNEYMIRFVIGATMIIIGLTIFLLGVDIGITPIGETMGSRIVLSNKIWIVAAMGLLLGFVISVAEPDLHILAGQVEKVTMEVLGKNILVVVVSVGVAVLISLGMLRIVYSFPLNKFLFMTYIFILIFGYFAESFFISVAFDASGSTTGALTVPFILALALGASSMNKDSESAEVDSFGLVGIASAGAILGVLVLNMFVKPNLDATPDLSSTGKIGIIGPFLKEFPVVAFEILIALLPITIIYIIANKTAFRQMALVIVETGKGSKVLEIAREAGVQSGTIFLGKGTASRNIIDRLGLSDRRKELVIMIAETEIATKAMDNISRIFKFEKPNHGIGYMEDVSNVWGTTSCTVGYRDLDEGDEDVFNAIYTIVNRGLADEVIDAAQGAGSMGGTVIHARGSGIAERQKVFSITIEPEKEIVMILSPREKTDGIVNAIREKMKIDEPGKGIIYVTNVAKTYGILRE